MDSRVKASDFSLVPRSRHAEYSILNTANNIFLALKKVALNFVNPNSKIWLYKRGDRKIKWPYQQGGRREFHLRWLAWILCGECLFT